MTIRAGQGLVALPIPFVRSTSQSWRSILAPCGSRRWKTSATVAETLLGWTDQVHLDCKWNPIRSTFTGMRPENAILDCLHMFANPSYSAWSPSKEAHAPTCSYVATGRRACRSSRRRDTSLPASAGCMHRTFFQFSAEALAGGAARCAVTSKCAIPTHRLLSCKVVRVHVQGSPLSIETTAASRRAQRLPLHRKTRARHARIGNVCCVG